MAADVASVQFFKGPWRGRERPARSPRGFAVAFRLVDAVLAGYRAGAGLSKLNSMLGSFATSVGVSPRK